ncbi:MAG: hypothetical protein GXY05_00875 [Clostridiales bacterium]|nr:hypothetical protein [Clostridiales bacterium]
MAGPITRPYLDPDGNYVMGYVIDNRTYKDPGGKNRVDVGSRVLGDDGSLYRMTENGGVKISGGSTQSIPAAQTSGAVTRPYLDPDGNYVMGYVIDNRTYQDPYGQNRVGVGSRVLGDDGTLYQMTESGGVAAGAAASGNAASDLPSAGSAQQYIKEMYAARREAALQAFKSAYDDGMNALTATAAGLPKKYQAARNQAAAQSEIQRANFNEYAAAKGLGSGAGGQAMLAIGNQLQSDLSAIGSAEADALAGLELQRAQLSARYRNDIAKAIADGNLAEAAALYDDFIRAANSIR